MSQDNNHTLKGKELYIIVGGSLFVLVVCLFLIFYIYTNFYASKSIAGFQNKISPVERLKAKPEVAALITKEATANSKEVFSQLDALSKTQTDKAQAESLKLFAASSLMKLDRNAGADYYIGIAKDLNNAPVVRAYAMTKLSQYAIGDGDLNLLKVFFDDPAVIKKMSSDEIKLAVNKKILEAYPMPLASANVARLELKKNPTKDNALLLRDLYFGNLEAGVKLFDTTEGLSHFLPVTYLAVADFLRKSEAVGAATTSEVRLNYDKAFGSSIANNQTETKQFIMLHYADYLLSIKLTTDAETVLKQFITENLTESIAKNLKSTGGLDYPNVLKYMKASKTQVAKDLSKKIGTFIQ